MVVYPFPFWTREAGPPDAPIPGPADYDPEDDLDLPQDLAGDPDSFDPFSPDASSSGVVSGPSAAELNALKKEEYKWTGILAALSVPCKVNVSLVEILPNKSASTVAAGLSRMYARPRSYGFPVYGLFTDRGGETVNRTLRTWCEARSICR